MIEKKYANQGLYCVNCAGDGVTLSTPKRWVLIYGDLNP